LNSVRESFLQDSRFDRSFYKEMSKSYERKRGYGFNEGEIIANRAPSCKANLDARVASVGELKMRTESLPGCL
jgi:hypothetical protein